MTDPSRPLVSLTEAARAKVLELIGKDGRPGLALRFGVEGRGPGGFRYRLVFATAPERRGDDRVIPGGGFDLLVDAASAEQVAGTQIEFVETLSESGFKIENPNSPWSDPLAAAVQDLLDREINPAVASHGGYVALVDVKDGEAVIRMGGGCQGCGMADVTLRQGIEARILEAVPGIRRVVDATDHSGGENPYYQSGEGGESPVA